MPNGKCRDCVPRGCAEAFADIRQTLGQIRSIAQATHEQAARTNGHVTDLFTVTGRHTAEMVRLETELRHVRAHQREQDTLTRKFLAAGWRVAVMLAGATASILGVKHLFR